MSPDTDPAIPRDRLTTEAISRSRLAEDQAPAVAPPKKNESGRALLFWKEGTNPGTSFVIPAGRPATVGRDPTCAVSIYDKSLSRQHAIIQPDEGGGWKVYDPGSANGTFVNGGRIRVSRLAHGDRVAFGRIGVRFFEGDAGDPAIRHLENFRLAVRKKLVVLSEDPDFIERNMKHRLRPWMRDLKAMLTTNVWIGQERIDAFSVGRLVLPQDLATLRERVIVQFQDVPGAAEVLPGEVALFVAEIEPIDYLAGRIGAEVPLDPHTWGERKVVVLEDHVSGEQPLSMGQTGKLDVVSAGSGACDLARSLPVRFEGLVGSVVPVAIAKLGRIVDEFEKIA